MPGPHLPTAPGSGAKVEFARIFGSAKRNSLKRKRACVTGISGSGKSWRARVAGPVWQGHKIGFLGKLFGRLLPAAPRDISHQLHSAYMAGFRQLSSRSSEQHLSSSEPLPGLKNSAAAGSAELSSPLGFTVAAAMELAGVCRLKHGKSGKVGLKQQRLRVDEKAIKRLDYLVNLSPQRLAYEYLAANRTLPNGYIERVLVPHYCRRLERDAHYSHDAAMRELRELQSQYSLTRDSDIGQEQLMELRHRVDLLVNNYTRTVSSTKPWSWMPRGKAPGSAEALSGKVRQVSVQTLVDQGRASRQVVRDYFIGELRRQGVGRVAARERVVALLNSHDIKLGAFLSISRFIALAEELKLFPKVRTGKVVEDYLALVDQIDKTAATAPVNTAELLKNSGVKHGQGVVIGAQDGREMMVIERPSLELPRPLPGYQCTDDDIWLITQRVERSWLFRWSKDMVKAAQRKAARNKRGIAVELSARLATAVVTGAMTGGIGGVMYLLSSMVSVPAVLGLDMVVNAVHCWVHGRLIKRYDSQGRPDSESARKLLYNSLAHVTAEQTLTDSLNAYSNLQDDLKGLKTLKGKANLSARDQIRYRRMQIMQQLRSAQLGEKFANLDRLMVETVTDISRFEDDFDKAFPKLWALFDTQGQHALTPVERVAIFNEAAHQLKLEGTIQVVREKRHQWLKDLVPEQDALRRSSDRALHEAFRDIKPLSKEQQRVNALACKTNWLARKTAKASRDGSKIVGHFLVTSLMESGLKSAKAGIRWFLLGVLPRKVDYLPIPTASVCVYWAMSFLGIKVVDRMNNAINRIRTRKVIATRRDENGEEVPFDARVVNLGAEDWRALRRESKRDMQKLADTLTAMHREHKALHEQQKRLTDNINLMVDRDKMRLQAAKLILRRKHLERKLQQLMAGVVGTFYQETVRGEWELRQALNDKGEGIVEH